MEQYGLSLWSSELTFMWLRCCQRNQAVGWLRKTGFQFHNTVMFPFPDDRLREKQNQNNKKPKQTEGKKKKKHIQCIAFNQTSAVESGFVCLFHFLLPYSTHGAILLVGRINSQPPNKPTTGPPGAVVIYFHN